MVQIIVLMRGRSSQGIRVKIDKLKHMLIDSPVEYLLGRVLLLESSWHSVHNDDQEAAIRSLQKCLELNEHHSVEYLRESGDIRK